MIRAAILLAALALAPAAQAAERKAFEYFGAAKVASKQKPAVIGEYAKGCIAGAVQLPETGPTWQAMRLSRNRNWGHPELIAFVERLGAKARDLGWAGLYVGDMSQPRGGPMTSGHQSHQSGLDVDIWMLPPKRLNLTRAERESLSSVSVRTADQTGVTKHWTPTHMAVLKAAAEDRAVDRIFVAAAVKIAMCKAAGKDRKWLQKIRPLYGHNYHFHVRLKCPKGSPRCKTQRPTVKQLSKSPDGCDKTLEWWVTDYLEMLRNPPKPDPNAKKKKVKRRKRATDFTLKDLPRACTRVVRSD